MKESRAAALVSDFQEADSAEGFAGEASVRDFPEKGSLGCFTVISLSVEDYDPRFWLYRFRKRR